MCIRNSKKNCRERIINKCAEAFCTRTHGILTPEKAASSHHNPRVFSGVLHLPIQNFQELHPNNFRDSREADPLTYGTNSHPNGRKFKNGWKEHYRWPEGCFTMVGKNFCNDQNKVLRPAEPLWGIKGTTIYQHSKKHIEGAENCPEAAPEKPSSPNKIMVMLWYTKMKISVITETFGNF